MLDAVLLIGLFAGACTTFCNIPQLVKSWNTKSTHDLSLLWLVILTVGVSFWLAYGLLIDSLPVILANVFTLILVLGILSLKLRYG